MHLKNDDSFDRRNVMLMLFSVVLFATNTLLVRAVAIHAPAANGWVAIVFRGAVGTLVVFALFGWGRGLVPSRLFSNGLVLTREWGQAFRIHMSVNGRLAVSPFAGVGATAALARVSGL